MILIPHQIWLRRRNQGGSGTYVEEMRYITRWCSWLRRCATRRKVAVSIPGGVIGNFHWCNPSFRPHYGPAVDSDSNRSEDHECLLGSKGGRWVKLTTLLFSRADCLKILGPQPRGTLSARTGISLTFLPGKSPLGRPKTMWDIFKKVRKEMG
jgi:hypothetical protein